MIIIATQSLVIMTAQIGFTVAHYTSFLPQLVKMVSKANISPDEFQLNPASAPPLWKVLFSKVFGLTVLFNLFLQEMVNTYSQNMVGGLLGLLRYCPQVGSISVTNRIILIGYY